MANELSTVLGTQWDAEVKVQFQQKGARIARPDFVNYVPNVNAEFHKFRKLASLSAIGAAAGVVNKPALGADVSNTLAIHSEATATLVDKMVPIYFSQLEMDKLVNGGDGMRMGYVRSTVAEAGKWMDDQIITAIDASNTALVTNDNSTGFTYAKLLEAIAIADEAEVDEEDRVLVVGARQISDMLNITQLTNNQYEALHKLMATGYAEVMGMPVIKSQRLTTGTNAALNPYRNCYLAQKSAIGFAVSKEPTTTIDWIPEKTQFLVNTTVSSGATVIESAGVINIPCEEV